MNGVHDLGGMHGFGRVEHEEQEPVFHAAWEGRIAGIRRAIRVPVGGLDEWRHRIERLEPERYLGASYYERWVDAFEVLLLEQGVVDAEALNERTRFYVAQPNAAVPRSDDPELAQVARDRLLRRDSGRVTAGGPAPIFAVGAAVRARNVHVQGHTRLPRYLRGKRGVVAALRGVYNLPDSAAKRLPPEPAHVYSVLFDGPELWGASAEPGQRLYVDLWEPYLEPASD